MFYIYLHCGICVLLLYEGFALTAVADSENAPLCESDWTPIGYSCYLMPDKAEDSKYGNSEGEVFCKTQSARLPVFRDNQDYKLYYEKVAYLNNTWLGYKINYTNITDRLILTNTTLTYVSNSSGEICEIGPQVLGKHHHFASSEKLCVISAQRSKFLGKNNLWETMWENMYCDEKYAIVCQKLHLGDECLNISLSTVRVTDVNAIAGATNGTKTLFSTDPRTEILSTTDSTMAATTAKMRTIESIEKRFYNNIPLICVISLLFITLVVALIIVKRKKKKKNIDELATPKEKRTKTGQNIPASVAPDFTVSNNISSNTSSLGSVITAKSHVKNKMLARGPKHVAGKKQRKKNEIRAGLHEMFKVATKL